MGGGGTGARSSRKVDTGIVNCSCSLQELLFEMSNIPTCMQNFSVSSVWFGSIANTPYIGHLVLQVFPQRLSYQSIMSLRAERLARPLCQPAINVGVLGPFIFVA